MKLNASWESNGRPSAPEVSRLFVNTESRHWFIPGAIRIYPPPLLPANPIYLKSFLLSQLWSLDPFVCSASIWNWASHIFLYRRITLWPLIHFFLPFWYPCSLLSLHMISPFTSVLYFLRIVLSFILFLMQRRVSCYCCEYHILVTSACLIVLFLVPIFQYHMTMFEFPQWRNILVRFPFVLACAKLELTFYFNIWIYLFPTHIFPLPHII
jgi:hypothetical protein